MNDEWPTAIEHLYTVFACYRRPSRLDASPARDPVKILGDLTSVPLRELPADSLGAYAGHAMTTVGSDCEYRHFLPRIIELSITPHGWMGLEPEQIAGNLNYGRWRTWPADAQEAIVRAFKASWITTRVQMPGDFEFGDIPSGAVDALCALAILDVDIASLLACWTVPGSADEARQMAEHIVIAADLDRWVYWRQAPPVHRRALWNWARSPAVRSALETAAIDLVADEHLWEIDRALIDISVAGEPEGLS